MRSIRLQQPGSCIGVPTVCRLTTWIVPQAKAGGFRLT
jgi:hypothetical protein